MAVRGVNSTELNDLNDWYGVGEEEDLGILLALGMGCTVTLLQVAKEDSTYSCTHKMTLCSRDVEIPFFFVEGYKC